jgi:HNH endonuclease
MATSKSKLNLKKKLAKKYGMVCYYCDETFSFDELTLDHIYPLALSPNCNKYNWKNLMLACFPCNLQKGSRVLSPEEFREEVMGARYMPYLPKNKKVTLKKTKKVYPKCDVKAIKPLLFKEVIFVKEKKSLFQQVKDWFTKTKRVIHSLVNK